jgi:hypothetical protein
LQLPAQAVAQQTPCAQMPELQSASAEQLPPIGLLPQLPLLQAFGGSQSASVTQVVWHWPVVLQVNGEQDSVPIAEHAPAPSHRAATVRVVTEQPGRWQITPPAYFSQAPAPSQNPSVPQVAGSVCGQSSRGSVPTSAGMQVPTLPVAAQVSQAIEQAVVQQTPSTQNPEPH